MSLTLIPVGFCVRSGMAENIPGHVSFMMSAMPLQQGRSLQLSTNKLTELEKFRGSPPLSFFGIFKLH